MKLLNIFILYVLSTLFVYSKDIDLRISTSKKSYILTHIGQGAKTIAILNPDHELDCIGIEETDSPSYYKVRYKGKIGWVHRSTIKHDCIDQLYQQVKNKKKVALAKEQNTIRIKNEAAITSMIDSILLVDYNFKCGDNKFFYGIDNRKLLNTGDEYKYLGCSYSSNTQILNLSLCNILSKDTFEIGYGLSFNLSPVKYTLSNHYPCYDLNKEFGTKDPLIVMEERIAEIRQKEIALMQELKKEHPDVRDHMWKYILKKSVVLGMTEEEASLAWGAPMRTNNSINNYGSSSQWVYGGNTYLYFKNGKLDSINN